MKYIIKKHCVATELCTIAIGRIQDYYYGTPKYHISRDFFPTEVEVDLYGFDTEQEANDAMQKRMSRIEFEKGDGMWDIDYSVLPVEFTNHWDDLQENEHDTVSVQEG